MVWWSGSGSGSESESESGSDRERGRGRYVVCCVLCVVCCVLLCVCCVLCVVCVRVGGVRVWRCGVGVHRLCHVNVCVPQHGKPDRKLFFDSVVVVLQE